MMKGFNKFVVSYSAYGALYVVSNRQTGTGVIINTSWQTWSTFPKLALHRAATLFPAHSIKTGLPATTQAANFQQVAHGGPVSGG